MGRHFQTLLEGIVANPEEPLDSLPLLTAAERHQLLVEWNDTRAYPTNSCVHQLFEEQARRCVKGRRGCEDRQYTYCELNEADHRLARHLRTSASARMSGGALPGTLAGDGRRAAGILKAGGAYVPIDPEYPAERLASWLRTRIRRALDAANADRDACACRGGVICLDEADADSRGGPTESGGRRPDNLAYMIYTSGSTGNAQGADEHAPGDRQPAALDAGATGWAPATACCRRRRSASTSRSGSSSGR